MSFKNFQQMNQFIKKYKSDIEKIENARRIIEDDKNKLLSIILNLWEKTESEELISIMDEVYQEDTVEELVKSEIPKELVRKGKCKRSMLKNSALLHQLYPNVLKEERRILQHSSNLRRGKCNGLNFG